MNYKIIAELSEEIRLCENAMLNIKEVGIELAKTGEPVNVSIKVENTNPLEGSQPKVNFSPDQESQPTVIIYGFPPREPYTPPPQYTGRKAIGLDQQYMPHNLALIMLQHMSDYYNERHKQAKKELDRYMLHQYAGLDAGQLLKRVT